MGQKITGLRKPLILLEEKNTQRDLEKLKEQNPIWRIVDIYQSQLAELFEISHPEFIGKSQFDKEKSKFIKRKQIPKKGLAGNWIYFSWNGLLIHMVNQNDYFKLRTNRNRNLITEPEQKKLYSACVGVVGLSVGSGLAVGLAYQGLARSFKLAEFDKLETTNLNRLRAGIYQIGSKKIDIASQQIYEIDPFVKIIPYPEGVTKQNLKDFVHKNPKPKIIFEIIDDFEMKILLRFEARKAGIPVIMMANLGDSILIDLERFDQNRKLPLFNGVIGKLPEEILKKPNENRNKHAVSIVGRENIPKRALESVLEIGKTLVGRPQLSSTVTIAGGLAAYMVKSILSGKDLKSGRYKVVFDNLFNISHNNNDETNRR